MKIKKIFEVLVIVAISSFSSGYVFADLTLSQVTEKLRSDGMDGQIHTYADPQVANKVFADFYDDPAEAMYAQLEGVKETSNYFGPTYKIVIRNGKNMWCYRGASAEDSTQDVSFKCRIVVGRDGSIQPEQD